MTVVPTLKGKLVSSRVTRSLAAGLSLTLFCFSEHRLVAFKIPVSRDTREKERDR